MAGTTHKFGDINYSIKFDVDNQSIQNLKQSLQEIQKMTTMQYQLLNPNAPKDIQAAYHELAAVKSEAEKIQTALQNAFNVNLGSTNIAKFTENLQAQSVNVKQFGQQLSKIGTIGPSAFRNLNTTLITTNGQLKESNKWLDKMAVTMSNTIRFGISSRIFNNLVGSLEKSWNFARQLDASLNDIRIVTGKSADEMERFAVTANRAAQNLGASTRDFTEAALIYYQQGLSDADANARAEVTLKAANVTGQSAQEVSEQLTAVWNGYQVSASEAEKYIDKLAAVAATTAADLEELSTGMSKVASAAAAMGVPIDELNAQLATIVSVTRQAPESVGTALRTIYARMGDIEAGTDEETTLGNYTEQMRALGVNVLDANGKLRDMGDVITEVGNN